MASSSITSPFVTAAGAPLITSAAAVRPSPCSMVRSGSASQPGSFGQHSSSAAASLCRSRSAGHRRTVVSAASRNGESSTSDDHTELHRRAEYLKLEFGVNHEEAVKMLRKSGSLDSAMMLLQGNAIPSGSSGRLQLSMPQGIPSQLLPQWFVSGLSTMTAAEKVCVCVGLAVGAEVVEVMGSKGLEAMQTLSTAIWSTLSAGF